MTRHVLAVDLKDDPRGDRGLSRAPPPRLAGGARAACAAPGVADMQIYMLGRRLVMVVDLQDGTRRPPRVRDAHAASIRASPSGKR